MKSFLQLVSSVSLLLIIPVISEESCEQRIASLCPNTKESDLDQADSPVFIEATQRLQCITSQVRTLREPCIHEAISNVIKDYHDGECKTEIREHCGKQLDDLEKEKEKESIVGVLRAASAVSICVFDHFKDIWEKCTERKLLLQCTGVKDDFGSKCDHNCNGKCCPKGACLFDQCSSTTCKKHDGIEDEPLNCKNVKDNFGSKCDQNCNGKCCPKGACLFDQCASTTCKARDHNEKETPVLVE